MTREWSKFHPNANATKVVSQSYSRIGNLNQRRFGLLSIMAVPRAESSVYRGGQVLGNGSAVPSQSKSLIAKRRCLLSVIEVYGQSPGVGEKSRFASSILRIRVVGLQNVAGAEETQPVNYFPSFIITDPLAV